MEVSQHGRCPSGSRAGAHAPASGAHGRPALGRWLGFAPRRARPRPTGDDPLPKARFWADYGLLAVEFEDEDDRRHFGVRGVTRQGDGAWTVSGGAGGGGWETSTATAPWANLGAWWDDRRFCAGGRVHGDAVRLLRLVDAAGRTVEDTVDEGIALVMHMGPFEQPWSVELYAADDTLLRRHPFHGGRPAAP